MPRATPSGGFQRFSFFHFKSSNNLGRRFRAVFFLFSSNNSIPQNRRAPTPVAVYTAKSADRLVPRKWIMFSKSTIKLLGSTLRQNWVFAYSYGGCFCIERKLKKKKRDEIEKAFQIKKPGVPCVRPPPLALCEKEFLFLTAIEWRVTVRKKVMARFARFLFMRSSIKNLKLLVNAHLRLRPVLVFCVLCAGKKW